MTTGIPLVDVRHVKKYFHAGRGQTLQAVDDVSFKIEKGKTLGLVGESGCGKTTVGRTIIRLYEPTSGEIYFDGKDISVLSRGEEKELSRKMQMIFQDPYASLNPFFTVGEIIGEGLEIHRLYPTKKERTERVFELLELVGLRKEHANRFPHEFSGGQRQRVGIARSLALNPEFIICDEAISALDVSIQAQVINMLQDFQRDFGLTYLFISHDLAMVRQVSNDTAVMYRGALVECGETLELYSHPAHPYLQGLIDSIPAADPDFEARRGALLLKGETPSPVNIKAGCRFYSRCPKARPECDEKTPELRDLGGGHLAACFYAAEGEI
jgi:oligopeptide transport system ATP-binding protein